MGWKEAWCVWDECGATAPPKELGKQEIEEDKEERDWGFRLEEQMTEGWDKAEEREGRGRHSSCPNEWLRDCLRVALDLGGCGVPSPCCPANRQLSTNLWEPMASWGSMWRWRRDIILGAVGKKNNSVMNSYNSYCNKGRPTGWLVERYSGAGIHFSWNE